MGDHVGLSATRILIVAVAVAAGAWFALGVRQGHDASQATQALAGAGRLAPAQSARLSRLLDHVAALNPDRGVDVLRARLQNHSGEDAAAVRTLEAVVHSEPRDIDAWQLMALVAGRVDPVLSRDALAHVHALAPPVRAP
jgi:predicted Zn-dependent protease